MSLSRNYNTFEIVILIKIYIFESVLDPGEIQGKIFKYCFHKNKKCHENDWRSLPIILHEKKKIIH